MDVLLDFQPFVFSSSTTLGAYVEGLPLTSPIGSMLASHGRIFGLFSLSYPEVFPLDQIGKEILPYFEEIYYKNECLSVHEHLLTSLRETQVFVEKKVLEYGSVDRIEFSLCMGVIWGSVLYVGRFGGGVGLRLYRDTSFGGLFEIDTTSGSSSVASMSGYIQPRDTLCLYNRVVDASHFPLSLSGLNEFNPSVVYSKLTQFFNEPFQNIPSCCVVGLYIQEERVPSVEEEQIIFVDVDSRSSLPDAEEFACDTEFIKAQLDVDSHLKTPSPQRLFSSEASMRGFSSKIIPSFARTRVFPLGKRVMSIFTKQRVFIFGCMLLILFAGFIFIGKDYENRFQAQKQSAVLKSELLPKAQDEYKQGLYYAELNPDRAKNYLQQARQTIAGFTAGGIKDPDVQKLIKDIDTAYGAVTKTYMLGNLSPYFDLSTVNAQNVGTTFSLAGNSLLISDVTHNSVYKVGTETRSASAVIGPNDLDGLIGSEGDDKIAYAISSKKGIVRTEADSSKVVKLLDPSEGWGTLADVQLFGGNLYVLDQTHGQIWKYIPEGNGFGPVRNYISSDVTVDLSDAISFSIDGNVWIGKKSGVIVKLFSGKQDNFSVTGVDGELTNVKAVYTDDGMDYLYILDDVNSRILVVSKKDGSYLSSYMSPDFKNASDMVVDSKNKLLYVLAQQKVFKVEVKESFEKKE